MSSAAMKWLRARTKHLDGNTHALGALTGQDARAIAAFVAALERIVGRASDGSGFLFGKGWRDVSWSFVREASARRAVAFLREVPGIIRVTAWHLDEYGDGKRVSL